MHWIVFLIAAHFLAHDERPCTPDGNQAVNIRRFLLLGSILGTGPKSACSWSIYVGGAKVQEVLENFSKYSREKVEQVSKKKLRYRKNIRKTHLKKY